MYSERYTTIGDGLSPLFVKNPCRTFFGAAQSEMTFLRIIISL